ncbi:MAG: response regulator transcription factor [Proteobacteria bacterium]|nr:response regulator transcription factor [Pseudomonadota bacterium]MBU4469923.1 response regulator transcription factor [Pseudomonadota bacterium]MCG2753685.1 response regulator transcription factor [Desulfobacteraceae bacterium]
MSKQKILAVEDDEDILELIRYNLEKEGYRVETAETGEAAVRKADAESFDLMLLDLMLPGMDGLEVARRLKKNIRTQTLPIIMITAKGEESDIVTGLELGADDYITKPFSPRVMIARVRSILRRAEKEEPVGEENPILNIHGFEIHPGRRTVHLNHEPADLTFSEFQILYTLAKRPGWVFTRYQIVEAVRGSDYPVTDRAVDVQIVGLRKKLGDGGDYIETVRGVGYRFKEKT